MCCAQSCPTLCDPLDCRPLASSVHGDTSGKNPGEGCRDSSKGPPQAGVRPQVSRVVGGFFTVWTTREAPEGFLLFNTYLKGKQYRKDSIVEND